MLGTTLHKLCDEDHEGNVPLTTDSATHLASRRIQSAGLNIHGTLYSFRRNFARTINDNLSAMTGAILMGHTPHSMTMKKSYTGQFPQLDTARLVQTGEITNVETLDPLLTPNTFLINDIRRYYLATVEIRAGVDEDEDVMTLKTQRTDFIESTNKRLGFKSKLRWPADERKELLRLNRIYKQIRRNLIQRLTREKLLRVNEQLPDCIEVRDGVNVLNEDLINVPRRPVPGEPFLSNKELEDFEKVFDSPNEEDSSDEKDYDIEEDILYEESQAADIISSQEDPVEDATVEVDDNQSVLDARFTDIQNLINIRPRPTGKNICEWCVEQYHRSEEYQGPMTLAMHLFESQASKDTWSNIGKRNNGMHSNIERWIKKVGVKRLAERREGRPIIRSCKFSSTTATAVRTHLRRSHWAQKESANLDEKESMEEAIKYFAEYFPSFKI
ncbi:hypothetical protein INT48_009419 [Thamnidium elegans]|uniref:Uncharacterized protein n=1 Tax=Thamnidium elegans TaxID=101142 RepID=A0A8H7VUK4_9FUNG|nr:hypothetical protein INT48_009419 [Thamnidium elegans]